MSLRRLVSFALAGVLAQAAFAQDDVTVFSARADSVAVTIYPDDLALITETRTVELPAAAATLVIQDVADTLLPQSAVVSGLDRDLAESNFDFNRLSPQSLIAHAVGQRVTLIRTDPATGIVTRVPATLVAAGEGVVLDTGDGNEALYCSGLPEGLVFEAIPDDLYATPQLSVRIAAGDPGARTIAVSYLAHGFTWNADYVAELDARRERMDLTGWATVRNSSSRAFDQAELQLVAGKLNVLDSEDGGSRAEETFERPGESQADARARIAEEAAVADAMLLRDCFESDVPVLEKRPMPEQPVMQTVMVTGSRIPREVFGDYHLYRLPWRTDLGARQTKQVRFLEQDDVTVERFYRLYVAEVDNPYVLGLPLELFVNRAAGLKIAATAPVVILRTENTVRAGLGEPLPAGPVRVFEAGDPGSIFLGQSGFRDRPVGAEVELELGQALDLLVASDFRVETGSRVELVADHRVINDKALAIDLEIRHLISDATDLAVEESSRPYELTGDSVSWRFTVPPGTEPLLYRLSKASP